MNKEEALSELKNINKHMLSTLSDMGMSLDQQAEMTTQFLEQEENLAKHIALDRFKKIKVRRKKKCY